MSVYKIQMYIDGSEADVFSLRKHLAQSVRDEYELQSVFGVNIRPDPSQRQKDMAMVINTDWSYEEKLCYIAHTWNEQEHCNNGSCLQDFDYSDMAKASVNFINSQPSNTEFKEHIDKCFLNLIEECANTDAAVPDVESA